MGARLAPLSNAGLGLAAQGYDKYADAAKIRASGDMALANGIAQGLAQITTNRLRAKAEQREDAQRKEAYARQDAREAKSDAREADRDQRSRDEFMLRFTEGKKGELAERMRAGDLSAQEEWAQNERVASALTSRLMAGRQAAAPSSPAAAAGGGNTQDQMYADFLAIDRRFTTGAAAPEATGKEAGGCEGGSCSKPPAPRVDVETSSMPPPAVSDPGASAPPAKGAAPVAPANPLRVALDSTVAERDARLRDHAKSEGELTVIEDQIKKARARLERSGTPVGIARTQAEIRDLETRRGFLNEKVTIDAAHATDATRQAQAVVAKASADEASQVRTRAEMAQLNAAYAGRALSPAEAASQVQAARMVQAGATWQEALARSNPKAEKPEKVEPTPEDQVAREAKVADLRTKAGLRVDPATKEVERASKDAASAEDAALGDRVKEAEGNLTNWEQAHPIQYGIARERFEKDGKTLTEWGRLDAAANDARKAKSSESGKRAAAAAWAKIPSAQRSAEAWSRIKQKFGI